MAHTPRFIDKALKVEKAVAEWFAENQTVSKVDVKELMSYLVEKKIFPNEKYHGLEVQGMVRRLYESNSLHLVPHVAYESAGAGTKWYFVRLVTDAPVSEKSKLPEYSSEVSKYRASLLAYSKEKV